MPYQRPPLVPEQQNILTASGQGMQGKADLPKEVAVFDQLVVFTRAESRG